MSAPDRIWARPIGATVDWTGATSGPWSLDDPHNTATAFLASTPAREHAEGLVEALRELMGLMEGVIEGDYEPDSFTNQPGRMLLSKLDHQNTGETDD